MSNRNIFRRRSPSCSELLVCRLLMLGSLQSISLFQEADICRKNQVSLGWCRGKKHRNSAGNKCLPFPNFPKYVQHLKSHILVWVSIEYPYDWMVTTKNRLRAPRIGQGSVTLSTDLGTAGRGKNCSTVRKLIL